MQTTFTPTTVTTKFQRTYQVFVEAINGSTFEFGSADGSQPLLDMEFNVIRGYQSAVQSGNFRIRNVNQNTRNNVFKDNFNIAIPRSVKVMAGYVGTPLATIFQGMAQTIMSYREEGGTDWITEIVGMDWGFLNAGAFSNWTDGPYDNPKSYTQFNVIKHLTNDAIAYAKLKGQTLNIGGVVGFTTPRYSYTAHDFTMNLLAVESNRLAFIDNGNIYVMPVNYVIPGDVTEISSDTGLLGSPKQQQTNLICQIIFEPSMTVNQQIYLNTESSEFSSAKNGLYKVVGVQHAGVISSSRAGKCITTVQLQYQQNPIIAQPGTYTQLDEQGNVV
ncbi:unnamed protein product [Sphagnum balticum]